MNYFEHSLKIRNIASNCINIRFFKFIYNKFIEIFAVLDIQTLV